MCKIAQRTRNTLYGAYNDTKYTGCIAYIAIQVHRFTHNGIFFSDVFHEDKTNKRPNVCKEVKKCYLWAVFVCYTLKKEATVLVNELILHVLGKLKRLCTLKCVNTFIERTFNIAI